MKRSGLALIVVVGVLGVLAVLAAAFVTMAQLERKASQQRLNAAKAYLLARSGIEDALARVSMGQDPAYGGGNRDGSTDGLLSGYEAAQEVFHATGTGTPADQEGCPARHALRPSFFAASLGNPARILVDGRDRGVSGRLSGDLGSDGNTYALKVTPESGFFLNGGDPMAIAVVGYNAVLRRVLGTLAEAIDREDGSNDGVPVDEVDGRKLIDLRPAGGWGSWAQIRDLALGGNQAKLETLRPYLALHAWVDKKVIAPNTTSAMADKDYHSWGEIKLDHALNPSLPAVPGSRSPDFERINGRIVGRAPVDLSWARTRRPALIALLANLGGLTLDEYRALPFYFGIPGNDLVGTLRSAKIPLDWTAPSDDCRNTADAILASTSELATWSQWNDFCDTLPMTGSSDIPQAKRDILKANFNPNSDLNKFNPNRSLWRSVDKSDLLPDGYTTEFSLLPLQQPRRIESLGRVLGMDRRVLASRTLSAMVSGPSAVRLSTQRELVCENLGNPDLPGDETGNRLPGHPCFLSQSLGAGNTWGHKIDMRATYPGTWMNGNSFGVGLQTYPEPCYDRTPNLAGILPDPTATPLSMAPADYDGTLQLATAETPRDAWYGVTAPTRDMKMLARFDDGLDLDVADAAPQVQPDPLLVTTSELDHGLLHATEPNTLYPDGAYSEKDRCPSWRDRGNAHGLHGLMSFWVKPNYALHPFTNGEGGHTYDGERGHNYVTWTNGNAPANVSSTNQFFVLGDYFWGRREIKSHFEVGHSTDDDDRESDFSTGDRANASLPHRWLLVTLYWDFQSPVAQDTGELMADAGASAAEWDGGANHYDSLTEPTDASDITQNVSGIPHTLRLGQNAGGIGIFDQHAGIGTDATFDEFAIWDFGGAGALGGPPAAMATLESASVLALSRFRQGRYYRESVYTGLLAPPGINTAAGWFSPLIRLSPGARILGLAWTQAVPRGLKAPLPAGGQAGVDGDAGPDGRIAFDLANAAGTAYLKDIGGMEIQDLFSRDAFSPVARSAGAPFRLHAVFQPNLQDPTNTPILDPLALDDVTLLYEPAGGARILAWEDGEG